MCCIFTQLQQYRDKLNEYQKNLNSTQINPDLIKQELILGNEHNAKFSYKILRSDIKDELETKYISDNNARTALLLTTDNSSDLTGNIVEIIYTNLSRSSYKGRKISKIVALFSNAKKEKLAFYPIQLRIFQNPYEGFWYLRSSAITVDYKFYDENNSLINFDNADNSWVTVGSLNSGKGRYEAVRLNSTGKVYEFKDSSVTVHNGNTLYSDMSNDIYTKIGNDWKDTSRVEKTEFPWGNSDWDTGLYNKHAYYGAGVFKINGDNLNITYETIRVNNDISSTWATISTTIPKGSGPSAPEIHYNYTNVALLC